nr:MAG TPA: hypothetical protein [Bacteriophage sp.]
MGYSYGTYQLYPHFCGSSWTRILTYIYLVVP